MAEAPHLFGLTNTNRDFTKSKSWGKNIFNNAFPASLLCYFEHINLKPVYLRLDDDLSVQHAKISVETVLGIHPTHKSIFFSFESDYTPYRSLAVDTIPRADLVILDDASDQCTSALEIKLTALPDNSTFMLDDSLFGCELVVRPDTIVYLALSIALQFKSRRDVLLDYLSPITKLGNWSDMENIAPKIPEIASVLDKLMVDNLGLQQPIVLQPVWKTQGRQLLLHVNAFDIFVWSNFAFTRLFFRDRNNIRNKPTRGARTIAWLAKMLLDYAQHGKIDHENVIDSMSYNTKNDKAFAVNGRVTQPYMACDELRQPRVKKSVIREIIRGGGENFLSPERRLDAAILSTPDLFE